MFQTIEFLTATSGFTVYRTRGDLKPHALEFMANRRQWNGWTTIEQPSLIGGRAFEMRHNRVSISHCCLCFSEHAANQMWQQVYKLPFYTLHKIVQPRMIPWLVVFLLEGAFDVIFRQPERLSEAPDLETAVAWDIIDRSI